jgi:hypothetical protein
LSPWDAAGDPVPMKRVHVDRTELEMAVEQE